MTITILILILSLMMVLPTIVFFNKDDGKSEELYNNLQKINDREKVNSLLMEWSSAISGRINEQRAKTRKGILKVKIPYILNNQLVMLNDNQEKLFIKELLNILPYWVEDIKYNNNSKGPFNYFVVYTNDKL